MNKTYSYCYKKNTVLSNIPEKYIVNITDVNWKTKIFKTSFFTRANIYINKDEFEKIKDKMLYPTCMTSKYLGAVFMNVRDKIVPVFIVEQEVQDETVYLLYSPRVPDGVTQSVWTYDTLPGRNIKVFTNQDDLNNYLNDLEQKKQEKRITETEAYDINNKQTPAFAFSTPKLKVVHIFKKTAKIPAKVGDIIEGKIPVIEKNANGYSSGTYAPTYTNYVMVYINGEIVKSLSPVLFQEVFTDNFVCEIVE